MLCQINSLKQEKILYSTTHSTGHQPEFSAQVFENNSILVRDKMIIELLLHTTNHGLQNDYQILVHWEATMMISMKREII